MTDGEADQHEAAAGVVLSPLKIPRWLERSSAWAWRLLLVGILVVSVLWLFSAVQIAVVPALVAMVLAAGLRPVAGQLCRWGVPAWLAGLLPILAVLSLVIGAIWFTSRQAAAELSSTDVGTEQVLAEVESWLRGEPFSLTTEQIENGEKALWDALVGGAQSWGASRGGLALSVVGGSTLALVLTFLFLKDGPTMWSWVIEHIAPIRRNRIDAAGRAAARTMAAYMRGVIVAGALDSIMIGIGLLILGVPLVLPLMILTFLAALFPVVGAVFAGLAAAVVALVLVGPGTALWVVGLAVLVQQIEGNVVVPMLMGRQVSLHPSAILLSLTAGGAVAGLPGAFLAVPVVAGVAAAVTAFGPLTPTADLAIDDGSSDQQRDFQ